MGDPKEQFLDREFDSSVVQHVVFPSSGANGPEDRGDPQEHGADDSQSTQVKLIDKVGRRMNPTPPNHEVRSELGDRVRK